VRLLIHDTFATATYTTPVAAGWVTPPDGLDVAMAPTFRAETIGDEDVALAPSSATLAHQRSHAVAPDIAVVADGVGAIAMRTPVRPDEIDATPVRLLNTSGAAELLARATLTPFYGIEATAWRHDEAPEAARAEVVIVEGAEALREPEAGFSEDLCRAWFILTATPTVTHVLLAPQALAADRLAAVVAFLDAARTAGHARRREWRPRLADEMGVGKDRASALWTAQRLALEEPDRRALLALLERGSAGTAGPRPAHVVFVEGIGAA
jgi:predicted solute-binding protein